MSHLFPHPPYANDQSLTRAFMQFHIRTRAVVSGSLLATVVVGASLIIPSIRISLRHFTPHLLRASFATVLATITLSEAFLLFHM
ncbi:hypothetical protein B0J13DRAFT_568540 [Dactylonectria estremocensis]|uniref:Uncharacterized protein n=1 Tax=Dactylonectria estremocensis TaxID=1079267 RepID=A0A9P9DJR7_9HYPO|nr:hypothetical protein B0J13DRAFT_568540 [Dactylonectria estremocensis]